ncbi:MAG: hypothetical protein GY943_24820, partial [Chloroflexi bacterium]|nr:hypothetical protein [Chloroflexota bacterium]
TYESDSDPITFNYPSHWIIDELEDGLVLQSDAELITDESFPTGALQFLFWREFDELLTPVEYAQVFVAEFSLIESQEAALEPSALTINGQNAATATYTGEFFGSPVVVRYTTFIQGEQAVASIAITAVSDTPTYVLPQDLTANSIRILGTAPQQVDFTNPTAVVQALFDAAAAADFTILPTLCDPLDENDGDTADICAITEEHELRDPFIEFFANGMILGEPEIDGNFAEVNFSFGPNNSETETMTLILRDGFWYLYSF